MSSIHTALAQPWYEIQNDRKTDYQFADAQHFEMKAELEGGCFKGE